MSDQNPAPASPWASAQRWFVVALLGLFIALSAQYTLKVLANRSAFVRWRAQLDGLDRGENIYDVYVYPNPPIMALVLKPLADIEPAWAGALLWYYLKVAMTLAALYWVFRLVPGNGPTFPPWAKALVVLLSLRPVMGDLVHGNVNLFILFLVVAGLYAFHKGRQAGGGLLIALAIACKVTPALFVPYLVWKRAWRALAGCGVGLVLFLWVVPSCFLGWAENQRLLTSWTNQMIVPFLVHGEVTSVHENQSLPGLAARLLTHRPSFIEWDKAPPHHLSAQFYDNAFDLPPAVPRWIVRGAELLFVGLVVWRCRRPLAARAGWRLAAEFGVVLLGMLLFSERTWKHHCVTLVLPFAVLCYYLSTARPGYWLRRYLIGTLVAVTVLMVVTGTVGSERGNPSSWSLGLEAAAKMAQVYGVYVWAYVLLLAALVVVLGRPDEGTAAPAPDVVPLPAPAAAVRPRQAG
jgi:hypothetical protein